MKAVPNPYEARVKQLLTFFEQEQDLPTGKFGCVVISDPKKMVETNVERINNSPYPSKVYLASARLLNWYRNIIINATSNK